MDGDALQEAVGRDPRFVIDEMTTNSIVGRALALSWTKDPFDRLIAAHGLARGVPLCTLDRHLPAHLPLLVPEFAGTGPRRVP